MADVPADTSTTATISVGGIITGVLDPVTAPALPDHDWYQISLTAGQEVTITLSGSGTNPVEDTYLRVRDANGNILQFNDDSGGQINVSKIVFTATTSGTYYIDAGSFDSTSDDWNSLYAPSSYTGTYTLSVQPYTPPPVWSYDQIADQLINGYWNSQGLKGHHFNVAQGGTITVSFAGLTGGGNATLAAQEKNLATLALAEWGDIIGVTFTPVTTGQAQITFLDSDTGSQAFTEDSTDGTGTQTLSATVHISTGWVNDYGTNLDSYTFQTYIHEIGHALGLGHAGDYNGTADYVQDALYANDAWSTTIMSYFSQTDNAYFSAQGFSQDLALTPMNADVVAMQEMYGLSTITRTGNTTYGFNSNAGRDVFNQSIISDNFAYTIFDSGGNDTLDYSGFAQNQTINLNPESFSNIGPGTGNVMIARGTIIENAIGGSGNDLITGNDVANKLIGNAGADTILGGAGDDFLTGGAGIDHLTGGAGNDTFIDTKSGLNGDTITDFSLGDQIVLTDASLSGFTFSLSGNTLTYTGGSVTLGSPVTGTFVASAAANGGVQLSLKLGHEVRNDFNGDGRSDILWLNNNGTVTDWLGQSNGSFIANGANAGSSVTTDWHVAGTGDFNGDGRSDILWRNSSGLLTDWLGNTNGGFAPNNGNFASGAADNSWVVVGTGDFNGDGRSDILWRNSSGLLTDWLGTASGSFTQNNANAATGAADNSWHVVETGDFNGDGRTDILWRNDSGLLTDWLGNANGGFTANNANFASGAADNSWTVAATGDFNGDGRADILWQNSSGSLTNWLGTTSGGFVQNSANLATTVSTDWHVQPHETFV